MSDKAKTPEEYYTPESDLETLARAKRIEANKSRFRAAIAFGKKKKAEICAVVDDDEESEEKDGY
jgi:hypothetical protein